MQSNIPRNTKVLEVGSGTGFWLGRIAESLRCETVGLDLSRAMLDASIAREQRAVVLGTAEALPFADSEFDCVVSLFNTLNHVPAFPRAFGEIRRVLKPGGVAIIMLDSKDRIISRYWHITTDRVKSLGSDPRKTSWWMHEVDGKVTEIYTHFFSPAEVHELLPEFEIRFYGIGFIPPLIPRPLRKLRQLTKCFLWLTSPIEHFMTQRLVTRSAHLLLVARKPLAS